MVAPGGGFAGGVAAWRQGLPRVRNAVRQDLVSRQLVAHLPAPSAANRSVVDLGCGQGTQAIALARVGYQVIGIDTSPELLDEARETAAAESPEVGQRLRFEPWDLFDYCAAHGGEADVVACHGVLMYLPTLAGGVAAVVGAARPGGMVSVVTRNRFSIAMRAGMSGDWTAAQAGFDARRYRNRLGLDEVRADEPDEVAEALEAAGGRRVAWYGVRLFTDGWADVDPPEDYQDLLAAEEEAGRRDPYRGVAALTHTVGVREAP
jgi:SAM-dependent methyltransferase